MVISAKIVQQAPVLQAFNTVTISFRDGAPTYRLTYQLPYFLRQNRSFKVVPHAQNMAISTENNHGIWGDKIDVVRPASLEQAAEAIEAVKSGGVIAVPTDTFSIEAVNRIYEIKGRKHTSPLAICVGDVLDIARYAVTDHLPEGLLHDLLPGPVTVVLTRGEHSILEKSLNPGHESIGVRVPDNDFIRLICQGSGSALALTSANFSGQPSSICITDFKNLWQHCAYVYDGGLLPLGRAGSTIVDLTKPGKYKIRRSGSAQEETVEILETYSFSQEDVAKT
ncbi:hypothetical protein V2J09_010923 [Rumex salicifolius]